MAFTNGSRNASGWLTGGTRRLLRELIGAPEQGIRTDIPQRPESWGKIWAGIDRVPSGPT